MELLLRLRKQVHFGECSNRAEENIAWNETEERRVYGAPNCNGRCAKPTICSVFLSLRKKYRTEAAVMSFLGAFRKIAKSAH